ncbi:MAG: flippase [Thermodesulfobacteriota bacterium]
MKSTLEIRGSLLVRNTALNFMGRIIPLVIAVVTIPYIIRGLGVERFGILSLAWIILGYFSLFDLGLGRATTKFVAEQLGKGEIEKIPRIIWTSLIIQTTMGVVGGIVLAVITPLLVEKVLRIPLHLVEETILVFHVLSIAIPIVVCSRNLRGVLEAGQRFDLINVIQIPSSSLSFLIPAFGIIIGLRLPGIVLVLTISWMVSSFVYLLLCLKVFPLLRQGVTIDANLFRPLFSFGGWVTLSNVLIPILLYLDRFLIGAIVSVEALAYYAAPYEAASQLLIIPGVLAVTLFPALSGLSTVNKRELERLYARSLKYIILILGQIVVITILFARDILHIWLGTDFSAKSTYVFQILAVGMLLNALAQMPANILDGIGRPDIRAKVFLSYVPAYIGLLWFLVSKLGIEGAALAWTLRSGLELLLFFGVSWKFMHIGSGVFTENGLLRGLIIYGGFVTVALLSSVLTKATLVHSLITVTGLILFALFAWRYILDDVERQYLFLKILKLKG